jgi:glycerol-3-phosphate dehydrogenase (NAD(P)+)
MEAAAGQGRFDGKVAVLGAGAWGTTLAWMLGSRGLEVALWARRPELAAELTRTRRNLAYRPEVELPEGVRPTGDIEQALAGAAAVILATPSQFLRDVLAHAAPVLPAGAALVIAAKGLERRTGKVMTEVAVEVMGREAEGRIGVVSGPNLSEEIALGKPAAAVVAGPDAAWRQQVQALLASPLFRVYTNCDTLGVQLCGALKNVIAIAAGMGDGLGLGQNAKATLVTRGLAEMARVVVARGGDGRTCWGLAGLGDLMVTCHSPLSRNHTIGFHIGRGMSLAEAQASVRGVAEGVDTCAAVLESMGEGTDLPLTEAVYGIIYRGERPAEVAARLMGRRWRDEAETWPEISAPR